MPFTIYLSLYLSICFSCLVLGRQVLSIDILSHLKVKPSRKTCIHKCRLYIANMYVMYTQCRQVNKPCVYHQMDGWIVNYRYPSISRHKYTVHAFQPSFSIPSKVLSTFSLSFQAPSNTPIKRMTLHLPSTTTTPARDERKLGFDLGQNPKARKAVRVEPAPASLRSVCKPGPGYSSRSNWGEICLCL